MKGFKNKSDKVTKVLAREKNSGDRQRGTTGNQKRTTSI